jgi:hypothetical protein
MRNQEYRTRYGTSNERSNQVSIRDSHDSKYFVNKNHPQHNVYVQQQKHDNGNHFGRKKNGNNGNGKGNNGNGKGNNGNGNGHNKGNDNGHGK